MSPPAHAQFRGKFEASILEIRLGTKLVTLDLFSRWDIESEFWAFLADTAHTET
jgi:hypothetical protein